MKKLILVTDAWHPQINGVVRVLEEMKKRLGSEYEITVIEPSAFATIAMPMYPEIRLALLPGRKVARLIEENNPDSIHITTEGPLGMAARRYCINNNLAFTTSYHTHFHLYITARFHFFKKSVYAWLRRFHGAASRTMVATDSLKRALEIEGFNNLVIWPLGVDTDFFKKNSTPDTPQLKKPIFLYVGRLAVEKSPEDFLALQLPGSKVVVGDGPDRTALESIWGSQALFVGYKQEQELVDWYSSADVLVFPSRTETFGLVSVEALACNLPVAAYDVMGPRDILTPGVDGVLGPDLQKNAIECLSLNRDNCRKKALTYSWAASAESFKEALVDIRSRSI